MAVSVKMCIFNAIVFVILVQIVASKLELVFCDAMTRDQCVITSQRSSEYRVIFSVCSGCCVCFFCGCRSRDGKANNARPLLANRELFNLNKRFLLLGGDNGLFNMLFYTVVRGSFGSHSGFLQICISGENGNKRKSP